MKKTVWLKMKMTGTERMTKGKITPFLVFAFTLILLQLIITGSETKRKNLDAAAVAVNNKGVGLMGQFNYEGARQEFAKLAQQFPQNGDIKINLAIAILNRQKDGDEKKALELLYKVLEKEPQNIRARYCAGLLELYRGEPQKALVTLQTVLKTDPRDAEALYFMGKASMQLNKYPEALDFFNRAALSDPYLHSAYYGMIMALRQLGKMEESMVKIKEFQRLKNNPRARLLEFKYTKMGRKAEAIALGHANPSPSKKPAGPLFNPLKKIPLTNKNLPRRHRETAGKPHRSSLTVADINGDGFPDAFITGTVKMTRGFGNTLLLGNPQEGAYTPAPTHPLASVTNVNAALWGDIDDDGRLDVYLCRRGPNQLWIQEEGGKWRNITNETKDSPLDNGNLDTVDGALFDADHDGDLDLFLVNADGPNELLNNNRDGTYRPLADKYGLAGTGKHSCSLAVTDLDGDRDVDIIVINQQPPHEVYINLLLWKYQPATGFDSFISAKINAVVTGDLDTDGQKELYTLDDSQTITQWKANETGTWNGVALANPTRSAAPKNIKKQPHGKPTPRKNRLALADIDGDGSLDFVLSDPKGWRVLSVSNSQLNPLFTPPKKESFPLETWSLVSSLRGPHLLGWNPGKGPLLWTPGTGRHDFITLKLSGRAAPDSQWRSNASAIGSRVAARIGSRWTIQDTFRNNSGPGQDLQPVTFGLAGEKYIDFVAIDWSDGVFQSELWIEGRKKHAITETQRQLSSCPVLFAWNGENFAFVSDLLGVGGIGYAIGPGQYAEPRPWENFILPKNLPKTRNGRLSLKLMEPMEEVAYMDSVALKAYHLPPGWFMTLDERMGIAGPAPTGKPLFYRQILLPQKAVNDRSQDVTAAVTNRDLKAAPPGPLDHRFIGRLQGEHVLTLTFSQSLDTLPGKPVLFADGWVEYPYSQTSFAAWQAAADYHAPSIDVMKPDGQWETLLDQFGYPAGMPRQMAVPLPPLPKGTRKLRIRTNQEIYWDRLAIIFAQECPEAQVIQLPLISAQLEQIGFPKRSHRPQRLPNYDYDNRSPSWDTRLLEGFYTRFGDVNQLVKETDNALAIFGSGEGLHMDFKAPEKPLPSGWARFYVLETKGWCKDMDFYTNTGQTIAPLPAIGNRSNHAKSLHKRYNTRYLSGRKH